MFRLKRIFSSDRLRFDRNELAGAFGDIGTSLPLLVGMILASGADGSRVLIVFGALQILSAIVYGIPMPVQPLKAVAAIVIAQRIAPPVIFGAGLSIGLIMLILTSTGLLEWLARIIPKAVVRGIQLGLGLKLGLVAIQQYIPATGVSGLLLAGISAVIIIVLYGNRRCPPALIIMVLGLGYALLHGTSPNVSVPAPAASSGLFVLPNADAILTGFLVLALAQIPLSLGNSVLATRQIAHDLFPSRSISHRGIGLTYSLMNLIAPLFGGLPVCHGSGGMAGHHAFGARTGGSVFIYGLLFISFGVFAGSNTGGMIQAFPLPVLGVMLLVEGLVLVSLMKDMLRNRLNLSIAVFAGVMSAFVPYGFLAGMIGGTVVYHVVQWYEALNASTAEGEVSDST